MLTVPDCCGVSSTAPSDVGAESRGLDITNESVAMEVIGVKDNSTLPTVVVDTATPFTTLFTIVIVEDGTDNPPSDCSPR